MKKKVIALVMAAGLALSMAACGDSSLFSDASLVKFDELYSYNDPEGLEYDQRVVVKGEGFTEILEEFINAECYPDTMVYDDAGNMIGMYDYDESTGLAVGWTSFESSTDAYTAFPAGEEVDLGLPDTANMIDIPGDVTVFGVIYDKDGVAFQTYMYFFLTDAASKDTVKAGLEECYGLTATEESDTILVAEMDADYMANYMGELPEKDAEIYATVLMQLFDVREYGGVNPYEPYAEHTDPTDFEYDERVVLCGSADMAVLEEYISDVQSMTEYVYGYQGEVVADYTYIECTSKESADKLVKEEMFQDPIRVSDTVLLTVIAGQDMTDLVTTYKGYNVLKDGALDTYVTMLEETYFTVVCE